mgnify:CR=1 FL=1
MGSSGVSSESNSAAKFKDSSSIFVFETRGYVLFWQLVDGYATQNTTLKLQKKKKFIVTK